MFTFTKKTDYAMLALSYLATEGEGKITGPREIARRYEIPPELLAKVMQTLSRHDIVVSIPGPTGGYRLERAASDISIGEIVEAVDGPLAIAQCWEEDGLDNCRQAQHCHLRGPLAEIQNEINDLLKRMTLADVCRRVRASEPPPTRDFPSGRVLTMHPTGQEE
ncbi:MAG: Rrf2 family transcriptional regulator [Armatimonadaceae bacterium]